MTKSKPTVSRRTKQLQEAGIIHEIDSPGRIKHFTVDPQIIQNELIDFMKPEVINELTPTGRKQLFDYVLSLSTSITTMLQQMLDLSLRYTKNFEKQKRIVDASSNINIVLFGGDFAIFGPIENHEQVLPIIAWQDILVSEYVENYFGVAPDISHPRRKLK